MSAYRFVTLTCDACGEIFDHGIHTRVRECRTYAAKRFGWSSRNGYDYCGRCRESAGERDE